MSKNKQRIGIKKSRHGLFNDVPEPPEPIKAKLCEFAHDANVPAGFYEEWQIGYIIYSCIKSIENQIGQQLVGRK